MQCAYDWGRAVRLATWPKWWWSKAAGVVAAIVLAAVGLVATVDIGRAAERLLGPEVETALDPTGRYGVEDLAAGALPFRPAGGRTPNLGVAPSPDAAFWIRFAIPDLVDSAGILAISIREPRIRRAALFLPAAGDGTRQTFVAREWSRQDASETPDQSLRYPVFAVDRDEAAGRTAYLRVETGSSLRGTVWLHTGRAFTAAYGRHALYFGLLLGAVAGLSVYLAAIGTALSERSLIALSAVALSFVVYVAADQGFLETALLPGADLTARVLSLTAAQVLLAAWIVFGASYLRVGRHRPRLGRASTIVAVLLALMGLQAAIEILAGLRLVRLVSPYAGLFALLFGFLLPLAVLGRETRRALLFIACWSPAVVGGAARLALDAVPALGASTLAVNAVYVGAGFSILVFGIVASFEIQARERRLRATAEAKEARLRGFSGIASDSFWEVEPDGRVVFASGPASLSLGLAAGADFFERLSAAAQVETRSAANSLHRAMRERSTIRSVPLAVQMDGGIRHFLMSGTPADTGGFRGTIADVTAERGRLDREALQQKMAALGQLAGGMAHELNNLLHPVINLGRRLRDRVAGDHEMHRQLEIVIDAGQRAAEIVAGVLTTVRPGPISGQPIEVDDAVARSVEAIRPAIPASVRIDIRLAAGAALALPPGEVLQVLSNLMANAVHAVGGAGVITVETRLEPDAGVRIAVSDDGEGMDEMTLRRAMEPFFTTRSPASGTGLGLPIVMGVVQGWGGTLDIRSEPGLGTTVAITIPLRSQGRSAGRT